MKKSRSGTAGILEAAARFLPLVVSQDRVCSSEAQSTRSSRWLQRKWQLPGTSENEDLDSSQGIGGGLALHTPHS